MKHLIFSAMVCLIFFAFPLLAQQDTPLTHVEKAETENVELINKNLDGSPSNTQHIDPITNVFQDINYIMLLTLVVFGVIVLAFVYAILRKDKLDSEGSLQLIILSLVILATLFLIVAGYDNQQLAPAFGILGTIAGYLLGRQNAQKGGDGKHGTPLQNS